MSTSELHSRLEHLVSYSSQLIFVSNDKTNQQSKIVDAFLGQQAEHTEVAIIDAKQTTFLQDYRKQLYKQLLGTSTTRDFERPLNQLLSGLNEHEGPILIIVSHAENLPQKFLQELWELVLQSRFAANKQHLNVLLFTQPEWAEQAKTWLPTHSGNKPILLNSSSILSTSTVATNSIEQTDLDQLISSKREQFAERIRGRATHYEAIQPVLRKPWLGSLITLLFVSVFGGMLYWQYPEVANKWWNDFTAKQPSANDASMTQTEALVTKSTEAPEPVLKALETQEIEEVQLNTSDNQNALVKEPIAADPEPLLVTDWKNAVKEIDSARTNRLKQNESEYLFKTPVTLDASLTLSPALSASNNAIALTENTLLQETLSQDEVALEIEYDAELEDVSPLGINEATTSSLALAEVNTKSTLEKAEQEDLLNFIYDENTLLKLPTNEYLLQITSMANTWLMQTYIEQNQLRDQLWIYKTQRDGSDWFVLLYSQSYSSLDLAKNTINSLSPALLQGPPFVKTTKQIQQEINR